MSFNFSSFLSFFFLQDGSAVEIVGLSYACLKGLSALHDCGHYSYGAVERAGPDGHLVKWSLSDWAKRIKNNFEKHFYVRERGKHAPEERRPDLINKHGIYKARIGVTMLICPSLSLLLL